MIQEELKNELGGLIWKTATSLVHGGKVSPVQVMNQYVPEGGKRENRYDVTILVNGLPLVHVELKRRGRSIREAFNQIERYGRESFWAAADCLSTCSCS